NEMIDLVNKHPKSDALSQINAEDQIDVSVVVPIFNEAENIQLLYDKLTPVLDSLGRSCEVILVDDGSTDGTFEILKDIQSMDDRVWVIRLRRNFGQAAAFSAGFDFARGKLIITIDGDLQNDPADIPKLIDKIDEGYDIVSGWRVKRKDFFLTRRLPSMAANALISSVTGVKLHDYGCRVVLVFLNNRTALMLNGRVQQREESVYK
ncbi:unnamed protein product, partial [marine sediment metagenome]